MARSFNGTSDKIEIAYAPSSADHSVVVLLKPGASGAVRNLILGTTGVAGSAPSATFARMLYIDASTFFNYYTFISPTGTSGTAGVASTAIVVGITFDDTNNIETIYLNAVSDASLGVTTAYAALTRQIIGPPPPSGTVTDWFNGEIQWIAWFDYALDVTEQEAIASADNASVVGILQGLGAAWILFLDSSTPADLSGNGVTITTTGTSVTADFDSPVAGTPANALATQVPVEALIQYTSSAIAARVSGVPVEAILTGEPTIRVSGVPVEVIREPPPPSVIVTQVAVEVLVRGEVVVPEPPPNTETPPPVPSDACPAPDPGLPLAQDACPAPDPA